VPILTNSDFYCGFWGRLWHSRPARRDLRRIYREADLSTEQARTQAPSRLSRAYGNCRRPQGPGGPALARTQAPQRL